jgi:hypothetical protein
MPTDQVTQSRRSPRVGTTVHTVTDDGEIVGQPGTVIVAEFGSPMVNVRWHDGSHSYVSVLDLYWSAR